MAKETCWRCHGRRFIICHTCEGSGKGQSSAADGERKAAGLGPASCPDCHGTGSLKCELCKGTGYLDS